ncbi:Pentatricopeptide repeat [Dillenia turbinata]|uniref:Pentatricopeptide repeat n=1 Tax=Dillenia turbinata TaxID=194707 RepID=A0AAN8Z788_9MAGN
MTSRLVFSSRFASSITLAENPLHIFPPNEHIPKIVDPVELFTNCKKYEKPTINQTKILHANFLKSNILPSDIFVANSLTHWYCKVNALDYARKLFDQIRKPNVVSWNILISGHNQSSLYEESWRLFCSMHSLEVDLNQFTYGSVLSACSALECVSCGRQAYGLVMKNGFLSNGYVRSGMIDLFAKHGCFDEALRVFTDRSCDDNVVCWNAIISGAVKNGDYMEALDLFCQMCSEGSMPNSFTFSSILTACSMLEDLGMGRGIQGLVIKCGAQEDVFVGTAVIDLYAKCGSMDEAVKEFSHMPMRNVVSWTAMISGFVQKDDSISALLYFNEMRRTGEEVNKYTVTTILSACAASAMFREGTQIHSWILKSGLYQDSSVKSSLINMYSKLGAINLSEMVFNETGCIEDADRWAAMITAFAQNKATEKAITLFQRMFQEGLRPGKFCNSSVLSIIDCLNFGRQVHCYILKAGLVFDISVGSSLFTMYSKCGSLEESYGVFKQLSGKDVVSWGSMIAGFAEYGLQSCAIDLFREMIEETIPDQLTLAAVLTACSSLSLKTGKEIHGYALRAGVGSDVVVGGALLTMYSRYGRLNSARRVFEMMPQKDEVSCSSMVSGYAQNGYNEEVLLLFCEMLIADLKIDSFILSSVLRVVTVLNRASTGTQLHGQIIKLGLNKKMNSALEWSAPSLSVTDLLMQNKIGHCMGEFALKHSTYSNWWTKCSLSSQWLVNIYAAG